MGFSKIWPVFFVLACCFLAGPRAAGAEPGEKITYLISPVGVSVYCDEGPVDLDGHPTLGQPQSVEQLHHRQLLRQLLNFTVDRYLHTLA